jgi:hypothetical protein
VAEAGIDANWPNLRDIATATACSLNCGQYVSEHEIVSPQHLFSDAPVAIRNYKMKM